MQGRHDAVHDARFEAGMLKELENRAFAIRAIKRLSMRLATNPRRPLWQTYAALEDFNVPLYAAAAERLGLRFEPGLWTKLRAWLVGSVPIAFHRKFLQFVLKQTTEYLKELEELRAIGPASEREFLDYMVDQEVVQIDLMKLGVDGAYWKMPAALEGFVSRYGAAAGRS